MCDLHKISKTWNIVLWFLKLKPSAVYLCGHIVFTGAQGLTDGHAATEQCGGTLQSSQLPRAKTIQQHRSFPRWLWRSQIWYSSSETQSGKIDNVQSLVYRNSAFLVVYMVCIYGQILYWMVCIFWPLPVAFVRCYRHVVGSELCDIVMSSSRTRGSSWPSSLVSLPMWVLTASFISAISPHVCFSTWICDMSRPSMNTDDFKIYRPFNFLFLEREICIMLTGIVFFFNNHVFSVEPGFLPYYNYTLDRCFEEDLSTSSCILIKHVCTGVT